MQGSVHCACADNLSANSPKKFPRTTHQILKKAIRRFFFKKKEKVIWQTGRLLFIFSLTLFFLFVHTTMQSRPTMTPPPKPTGNAIHFSVFCVKSKLFLQACPGITEIYKYRPPQIILSPSFFWQIACSGTKIIIIISELIFVHMRKSAFIYGWQEVSFYSF